MLYQLYQMQDDMWAPIRSAASRARLGLMTGAGMFNGTGQKLDAMFEMISRFQLTHASPGFKIDSVVSGGRDCAVTEEVAMELPFGQLRHFVKDTGAVQPKVLVVAPLSGHFATLLRNTVEVLLRDHDVYVTDWINARDVPLSDGPFGVEDYVEYLIRFMEHLGPGCNVLAVCQPCVQTLIAVSVMSEENNPATPRTMTLMAGPIDVRESPTEVNALANDNPLSWFEKNVMATVPARYPGAGRRVYPGFVQLTAFLSMNMDRHRKQHQRLYDLLAAGEVEEAAKIKDFYDEYRSVCDMTAEFYLQTVQEVFQDHALPNGTFLHRGKRVDLGDITRTALLAIEGERDDISGLGQTKAALELTPRLDASKKRYYMAEGAGHYGIFNGSKWRTKVAPVVEQFIATHG